MEETLITLEAAGVNIESNFIEL